MSAVRPLYGTVLWLSNDLVHGKPVRDHRYQSFEDDVRPGIRQQN